MPISITITDITNLTEREVGDLRTYLLNAIEPDNSKLHVYGPASKSDENGNPHQEFVEEFKKQFGTGKNTTIVDDEHVTKPRKKRKAKIGTPEGDTVTLNTVEIEEPRLVKIEGILQFPETTLAVTDFKYDELISYILENTREKKITHDQIMMLVAQFELPSLNELEKFPDKIGPFYNALVEIVNA